MPSFVVPHKSGAHRVAAIALYRALLSQCKKLALPADRGEQLRNLIHYRFSNFRYTTSHRELRLLFEAGYEAVDHLDAAVAGESESKEYVLDLLHRAPQRAKKGSAATRRSVSEDYNGPFSSNSSTTQGERGHLTAADVRAVEPSAAELGRGGSSVAGHRVLEKESGDGGSSSNEVVQQDELNYPIRKYVLDSIFMRPTNIGANVQDSLSNTPISRASIFECAIPREQLGGTGQRQVPKIFSANSIPVLRFHKPQPPALTGYLNSRIKQRQKRHDLRHAMEHQLSIAALEDQWDATLHEWAGGDSGSVPHGNATLDPREPGWESEVRGSLDQVNTYIAREKEKNRLMAEKMYAVIDREQQLVEQEREEDERRAREVAEGLEGLSDMVSDIIDADVKISRPLG